MNYYERIQNAVDYMEEKLEDDIVVEQAAKKAYMSTSNFHRLFFAIVGYSAKEYMICRRISEAAEKLRENNAKVIDIAMQYAYESPDAFSRIFKKIVGCTPTTYAQGKKYYAFERKNVMEQYFKDENEQDYPDIKVMKELPDQYVAYYCYYGENPEAEAFRVMSEWAKKNLPDVQNGGYHIYGYNAPDSDEFGTDYGYEVCVTIPQDFPVEDPFVKKKKLVGGLYAVVSIERKPQEELGEQIMFGWQRFGKWLENSKYIYGNRQALEEHLEFDKDLNHLGGVDLYMPIAPKSELANTDISEETVAPFPVVTCVTTGRGAEKKAQNLMFEWAKQQEVSVGGENRIFAFYDAGLVGKPEFFYKLYLELPKSFERKSDVPDFSFEEFPGGMYLRKEIVYCNNAKSWYNFIELINNSKEYTFGCQPFMEEYLPEGSVINRSTKVIQHMPVRKK